MLFYISRQKKKVHNSIISLLPNKGKYGKMQIVVKKEKGEKILRFSIHFYNEEKLNKMEGGKTPT